MSASKVRNVPHVPRLRALRDARAMVRNPLAVFERYRRDFGATYSVHMGGGRPSIVSSDPDFARYVLQRNASNYHMSDIRVKRMAEFQGQGLLNSHGKAWLEKRRFLQKGFTPQRLSALIPMQERVLAESLERLDQLATEGPVDIGRWVAWTNFRLFGRSLFGSRITDDEIQQIAWTIQTVQRFMVRQIVRPYLIPWYRISGQSRHHQDLRQDADAIARRFIAGRGGRGGDGEGDLLQLMLGTPYPVPGERMSEEQVLIEALQLFVAGNETSPTALSWAVYLLSRRPELVGAMREEVAGALGDGPLTLQGLHGMGLVHRVLQETLRLYPSFWMMDRVALNDDQGGPVHVPAGVTVLIHLYGLHRNPGVWDDPDRFDPSRFEAEARKERSPFAYLPFGGGPRKCIGSTMATAQMLLVLARLVARYDFEPVDDEPVEPRPMMILHPSRAIRMRVRRA